MISVKSLNIIITEKCNLECEHCMRGNASSSSITASVLDKIFSNINEINHLNITGGEPFCDISAFKLLVDSIRIHNIVVDNYGIITNGTIFNKDVVNVLDELDHLCVNDLKENNIFISIDHYHTKEVVKRNLDNVRNNNLELFRQYCRSKDIYFQEYDAADSNLVDVGRGRNITYSIKSKQSLDIRYGYEQYLKTGDLNYIYNVTPVRFDWYKEHNYYGNRLTINPSGDVCLVTDVSFDDAHNYRLGNLFESNLDDLLDMRKQEEEKICIQKMKGLHK